eukprot:scaffold248376_cov125-Cyclotella_meneghiniana.AAC.1
MPPKSAKKPAASLKKANAKSPAKVLEERMSEMNLSDKSSGKGTSFSMTAPKLAYEVREGNRNVAYYELLAVVGKEFLRHCKVLPGGLKLSVLFGYPRALVSERASRKILAAEGIAFHANHARVVARATQVEHVVNSTYELEEDILEGDPQVVSLNFKCEEGPINGDRVTWMKWRKKGGRVVVDGRVHQQYYDIMIIKVVSQETYKTGRVAANQYTLEDSDNTSDSCDEEEDDNNNEEDEDMAQL